MDAHGARSCAQNVISILLESCPSSSLSLVDLFPSSVSSCLFPRLSSCSLCRFSPPGVKLYRSHSLSLWPFGVRRRPFFLSSSSLCQRCRRACVILYLLSWRPWGYLVPLPSSPLFFFFRRAISSRLVFSFSSPVAVGFCVWPAALWRRLPLSLPLSSRPSRAGSLYPHRVVA